MTPDSCRDELPVRHSRDVGSAYNSWASSHAARSKMLGNRRRDTAPELAVRRAVHALGLRYRVDARPLPTFNRRADLVFSRQKVAVFIDGCYWHGCPDHGRTSATNSAYWAPKIRRNQERDAETTAELEAAGWTVVRIWEHEEIAKAVSRVVDAVKGSQS
jgi:DNA mismatch endonuclease (patch repair protein)